MYFIQYALILLAFTFVFWSVTRLFLNKKWSLEMVVTFIFVILFSMGVAAITFLFSLKAKYIWIYYLVGAFYCFNVNGITTLYKEIEIKPQAQLLFIALSVLFFILPLVFLQNVTIAYSIIAISIAVCAFMGLLSRVLELNK